MAEPQNDDAAIPRVQPIVATKLQASQMLAHFLEHGIDPRPWADLSPEQQREQLLRARERLAGSVRHAAAVGGSQTAAGAVAAMAPKMDSGAAKMDSGEGSDKGRGGNASPGRHGSQGFTEQRECSRLER